VCLVQHASQSSRVDVIVTGGGGGGPHGGRVLVRAKVMAACYGGTMRGLHLRRGVRVGAARILGHGRRLRLRALQGH
jgi:hypothetical protein